MAEDLPKLESLQQQCSDSPLPQVASMSSVECSTPVTCGQDDTNLTDSSSAAQESIEPEQTAKDTFTIASTDTHNSIEEKKKASNDEQADFDDVFSSVPAWMDVPEEYLDISASSCVGSGTLKDSSNSDFSFDIEAILSSIRVLPKISDQMEKQNEGEVHISEHNTVSSSDEGQIKLASSTVEVNTEPLSVNGDSEINIASNIDQDQTKQLVSRIGEDQVMNGKYEKVESLSSETVVKLEPTSECNNDIHEEQLLCGSDVATESKSGSDVVPESKSGSDVATESKSGSDSVPESKSGSDVMTDSIHTEIKNSVINEVVNQVEKIITTEKRQRRGTFTKDDDEDTCHNEDATPTVADEDVFTDKLPVAMDKPLPQDDILLSTSSVSVDSCSVSGKSSTTSVTSQTKTKPLEKKPGIKPPSRSLKKPGHSLLPSKPSTTSLKPRTSQTGSTRPTSTGSTKREIPAPSKTSKTGLTRPQTTDSRTNSVKPVIGEKKKNVSQERTLSKSSGSGLPTKAQPMKATVPAKTDPKRRPISNSIPKPGATVKSSSLAKPKSAPALKSTSDSKTSTSVITRTSKVPKADPRLAATKRRSIATTTPSKYTVGVASSQSSPDPVKRDGSFVREERPPGAADKKKRRSFIPTPSRATNVSPTKKVLSPIPLNMDDSTRPTRNISKASSTRGGVAPTASKLTKKSGLPKLQQSTKVKAKEEQIDDKQDVANDSTQDYDPNFELQLIKQHKEKLCSKVVHSPADRENKRLSSPHSEWSPIQRNKGAVIAGDECFQCTKYTNIRNQ